MKNPNVIRVVPGLAAGALALVIFVVMGDAAPVSPANVTLAANDKARIQREEREHHRLDKKRERRKERAVGREADRARTLRKQRESLQREQDFQRRREAIESLTEEPPAN
jgi:hypothetical protein